MTPLDPSLGLPIVYIVDDEDVVRDALAWLLRSRRLLSEGFASAEAFEAAAEQRAAARAGDWPDAPACVLLDVRMPGMGGLALFERLIERGWLASLPVIFLTGHGDVPTAVAAVKRGAFDFVEKPFSNNALVDRVEQALQSSAQALAQRRQHGDVALRLAELTERERDVMRLVVNGLSLNPLCSWPQLQKRGSRWRLVCLQRRSLSWWGRGVRGVEQSRGATEGRLARRCDGRGGGGPPPRNPWPGWARPRWHRRVVRRQGRPALGRPAA